MRSMATVRHWTFPGPPFLAHVKSIGLDPDDPEKVLGAVEEGWLVRSTDGGKSWENLQDGTEFDSHTAQVLPGSGVVISTSGKGVMRSEDGGDSFVATNDGLERRYVTGVAFHPSRPERILAAAAEVPPPFWRRPEGASGAFFRSTNQGRTWTKVVDGVPEWFHAAPRSITQDPLDPETAYIGMTDGTVWATADGGDTFRTIIEGVPAPVTAIAVVAAPTADQAGTTTPDQIRGKS